MKRKKRNQVAGWRNDRQGVLAVFADNKKFLMPGIFFVAVLITVAVAHKANSMASESALIVNKASMGEVKEIEDIKMEECKDQKIIDLVNSYYQAQAEGNKDVVNSIYKGLDDTQGLKAEAISQFIEKYESITVYTKPGPVPNSYIAYVYNMVKLVDYDKALPGLETLYICTDENGELYFDAYSEDKMIIDYIKSLSVQSDVIDLNNKVASEYNEMINADENLAAQLTAMRKDLQAAMGEAMVNQANGDASADDAGEAASEETSQEPEAPTTHTIKAKEVVKIRKGDSTDTEELGKTEAGQELVEIEAQPNGWSKIEYNGGEAFVKTEFFDRIDDQADNGQNDTSDATESDNAADSADGKTGNKKIKNDAVNLRKGQGTDSAVLACLDKGATVNVIENSDNGWSKVEYQGQTGYIKTEFIEQ
ncbi:SH3 domain-containing protein [Butyrivibrio hungatei]|uniref:SH3 domain-containing protein n=1 Tax=Butyrivibrio hungatei TaxID=185008 RepID=A0A1G5FZU1_9FIRM|nr:SH3 domain-containing protein [Butyrivibrio hungatei]SCY44659.1 SH3 domain-containing protein [Butyrivibrio hungatei]